MEKQPIYHLVNGRRVLKGYRKLADYQPVVILSLVCGRELQDGSRCKGVLAIFERDPNTRDFHLRPAEPMHFLADDNAEATKGSYRSELAYRRELRETGHMAGTPHTRNKNRYPCPSCLKTWEYNDAKLCKEIRIVADRLEVTPYNNWVDMDSIWFTDPHEGGLRQPHVFIKMFQHSN